MYIVFYDCLSSVGLLVFTAPQSEGGAEVCLALPRDFV